MKYLLRFLKPCIKDKNADYALMVSIISAFIGFLRLVTEL